MQSETVKRAIVLNNKKLSLETLEKMNTPSTSKGVEFKETETEATTGGQSGSTFITCTKNKIDYVISKFCYPTLIILPICVSIIILVFLPIPLMYKIVMISMLMLSAFSYYSQCMKPKFTCQSNATGNVDDNTANTLSSNKQNNKTTSTTADNVTVNIN